MRIGYALIIAVPMLFAGLWLASWVIAPFVGYELYCKGSYHNPDYCTRYDLVTFLFWNTADFFESAGIMFTVVATVFIAYFTFTLRNATTKLGTVTNKQATISRLVVETARASERPYVKMSHMPPGLKFSKEGDDLGWVTMNVKNFGRTPASITDAHIRIFVWSRRTDLPLEPEYQRGIGHQRPTSRVLKE
jgi:hypothetical protein